MNFEQFHLPGFLLRDLYKESLVELNDIQQTTEDPLKIQEYVLGNNLKKVLILVSYTGQPLITDPDLSFLLAILKACKLSLNDVAILNMAQLQEIKYQTLIKEFNPKVMLLFGAQQFDISLPVVFPDFQIHSFKEISFLSSPSLPSLQLDEMTKRKLWECLKQIFLS